MSEDSASEESRKFLPQTSFVSTGELELQEEDVSEIAEQEHVVSAGPVQDEKGFKVTKVSEVRLDELGGVVEGRISLRKNDSFFTLVLYDGSGMIQIVARDPELGLLPKDLKDDECIRIVAFKTRKNNGGFNRTFHACEIHLIKISTVERCSGGSIPEYPFITVKAVGDQRIKSIVNIIAIVYNIEPEWESNPKTTRFINLVDETLKFVTLRLVGDFKGSLDAVEGKCVTLFNMNVSREDVYSPRYLDNTPDTKISLGLINERARQLQDWFDAKGRGEKFTYVQK